MFSLKFLLGTFYYVFLISISFLDEWFQRIASLSFIFLMANRIYFEIIKKHYEGSITKYLKALYRKIFK